MGLSPGAMGLNPANWASGPPGRSPFGSCNMLTPGGAVCASYSGIVDVFVETIGGYAGDLTDELLDEQDPLASKVLTRRIDESAQWLNAIAALRDEVLEPHTNRIAMAKRRSC